MEIEQCNMEGRVVQGRTDIIEFPLEVYHIPNPDLFEYKIKTGRSYPSTISEWEVY